MYLPEPSFQQAHYGSKEIFFNTSRELVWVLMQGNPVYLVLNLPGLVTSVSVCFPAPTITRVYAKSDRHTCFIGESEDPFPTWTAPIEVSYRYGMSFCPWMFVGHLNDRKSIPVGQDQIVNYIVSNCSVGHQGVNIRLLRSHNGREKEREWLEIYQFDTGNEYHFAEELEKHRRLIARFVVDDLHRPDMTWKPEGGWKKYRSETVPRHCQFA